MNSFDPKLILIIAVVIALGCYVWLRIRFYKEVLKASENMEKDEEFLSKIQQIKEELRLKKEAKLTVRLNNFKEVLIDDALKRSKSVSKGQIIEHFAPFLLDGIEPSETVFCGSPIDLICFKDIDQGHSVSIDFIEIKTGKSSLSKKQRLIRDAIMSNRVFYKEVKLS